MNFVKPKKLLLLLIIPLLSFGQCVSGDCVNGQGTFIGTDGSEWSGAWENGKFLEE